MTLHKCKGDLPAGHFGPAIDEVYELENGELWAFNGECRSQVNFCPYCGFKARIATVIQKKTD